MNIFKTNCITNASFVKVFTLTIIVKVFLVVLFAIVENTLDPVYQAKLPDVDVKFVILGLIVAPIVETFLFQFLPFFLMSKINYFRTHYYWIIAISALLFASTHDYSHLYFIYAIISGAIYSFVYILRYEKGAYWSIVIIHLVFNLITMMLNTLFPNF